MEALQLQADATASQVQLTSESPNTLNLLVTFKCGIKNVFDPDSKFWKAYLECPDIVAG